MTALWWSAKRNLIGSLQDLVTTILDTGEPPLAARHKGGLTSITNSPRSGGAAGQ